MKNKIILFIAAGYLVLLLVSALFPFWFSPFSYSEQHSHFLLHPPSTMFWLGTDELGRDLLARLLYGARLSLACALTATLLAGIFGILYGSLSGFKGGLIDQVLMRFLDLLSSIPDLLFYILLGLFLGRNFTGLMIALSLLAWIDVARITRGEILKHKNNTFVESAQALGVPSHIILFKHVLPQGYRPIFITLLFKIPSIILAESTLSFIGLGIAPPYSSWGSLASEGYSALQFYPHLILFPCLFIFLTILAFQVLGKYIQEIQ